MTLTLLPAVPIPQTLPHAPLAPPHRPVTRPAPRVDGWTLLWLALFFGVLAWSGWRPKDRLTWLLEVAPALAGLVALAVTRRRFPLTPLSYWLILGFSFVLMVGGKYTYAQVPLGDWVSAWLGWPRNNYDKLGHFLQGFVPGLVAREVLLRLRVVNGRGWLYFVVVCFALALSATYELVEWAAALLSAEAAQAFLGTQGYVWDTQSDMFMALVGVNVGLLTLAGVQDRQIARLEGGGRHA